MLIFSKLKHLVMLRYQTLTWQNICARIHIKGEYIMNNDFFNQLNNSCRTKKEIVKEKSIQQKKISDENEFKLRQAQDEVENKYGNLIQSFLNEFKNGAINAVSQGKYIEENNKKLLKGVFKLWEYEHINYDSENRYDLFLSCEFYKPIEKNQFPFGKKTIWEKEDHFTRTSVSINLYEDILPVSSYHIPPYDKFLRKKCDVILYDKNFLAEIKNLVPTIKFDKVRVAHEGFSKYDIREFSFVF